MRAVVLSGGRSSEHEVSLNSGESVAAALRAGGHDVQSVRIDRDGVWRSESDAEVSITPGRGLLGADVVFPVLHGPFGEDGTVQGLLETVGVPYVGSGVLGSAANMDKVVSKELAAQAGIPQVAFAACFVHEWEEDRDAILARCVALGFPQWVKPARLGSSVGIVRVAAAPELPAALDGAFAHDPRVIAEAHAQGLEVECGVLGDTVAPEGSTPGEIALLKGAGWYDYEAKYAEGGMELIVPARIPERVQTKVRELACRAFTALGCHGLARVDFFVDGDVILLNEINTLPGFTSTSVYPKLWAASGVDYPQLLTRLADLARKRYEAEQAFRF